MNKEAQEMCLNCYNLGENGKCKLAWISSHEQNQRAKSGFCNSSLALDADGKVHPVNQIRLNVFKQKSWFAFLQNK